MNKILFQSVRRILNVVAAVFAAVFLLAACGNSEKAELLAVAKVMYDSGYTPELNQQYQQRLMEVKTDEEAKKVIEEMLSKLEPVPQKLNELNLKTESVRSIRNDFSEGLGKILYSTRQMLEADPQDQAAALAISKEVTAGQQQLLDAQSRFMLAAGRHGLKSD